MSMKPFWVRFEMSRDAGWEYAGPWWISGETLSGDVVTVCAAVMAHDEAHAREVICEGFDEGQAPIAWSFVHERSEDWSPFCERFPRASWMQWDAAVVRWWRGRQAEQRERALKRPPKPKGT